MTFPHKIVGTDINYIHTAAEKEFGMLSGNKLLLTGAGGFLGYYFILSVLDWNDKHPRHKILLTALSRFGDGLPTWLKHLEKRKDLEVVSADVTKDFSVLRTSFDYVIHAASFASPIVYRQYPIETINANVLGLYALLNNVVKAKSKLKRLLYFSSSEIYGDPTEGNIPTPESYRGNVSCTGPRACYDESKRFCETLCTNYVRVHGLSIVIARPFNNYGPGMRITDGRVVADFARNIISNKDIALYSDGNPSRTFCYVTDAIVGYIKILTKGRQGEAYNIGTPAPEISMGELAQRMVVIGKKYFSYTGKIHRKIHKDAAYLVDNPQRRCPSIDKAKAQLGYNPSITLEDGLHRSLLWYQSVYGSR